MTESRQLGNQSLGRVLFRLRDRSGLTQPGLVEKLTQNDPDESDLTPSEISRWEHDSRKPSKKRIGDLAKVFGLSSEVSSSLLALAGYQSPTRSGALENLLANFKLPENLPAVRKWLGRSRELYELRSKLLDTETAGLGVAAGAIGLIGSAGIGKTVLASQILRTLSQEESNFQSAAWESLRPDLSTLEPPNFNTIMDSLLLKLSDGEITPTITAQDDYLKLTDRVISLFRAKRCLVVFDNVETVGERTVDGVEPRAVNICGTHSGVTPPNSLY